jgi:prefoldin subunit 5
MELEDRLAKLLLASIVRDLEAEREAYKSAVNALDKAIAFIGEAREEIEDTAKVIGLVSKAIGAVEKALKVAAKLGGVP